MALKRVQIINLHDVKNREHDRYDNHGQTDVLYWQSM